MPHIHTDIDFVVNAFIVHHNHVLLIDHKKLKSWLPVGGHIELNEDPEHALRREVREECGLEIDIYGEKFDLPEGDEKQLPAPTYMNIHRITDTHRHIALNYLATCETNEVVLNTSEHNGIRWFSKEDLNDPKYILKPAIRFYALDALKRLS